MIVVAWMECTGGRFLKYIQNPRQPSWDWELMSQKECITKTMDTFCWQWKVTPNLAISQISLEVIVEENIPVIEEANNSTNNIFVDENETPIVTITQDLESDEELDDTEENSDEENNDITDSNLGGLATTRIDSFFPRRTTKSSTDCKRIHREHSLLKVLRDTAASKKDVIVANRDKWSNWFDAVGSERPFQVLVCMLLTNKSRDSAVGRVMANVKAKGWIMPTAIIKAKKDDMEKVIFPLGCQTQRVMFLKNTAKIILKKYRVKVPNN